MGQKNSNKISAVNNSSVGVGASYANIGTLVLPECKNTGFYNVSYKVNSFTNPSSYGKIALAIDSVVITQSETFVQSQAGAGTAIPVSYIDRIYIKKGQVLSVMAIEQAGTVEITSATSTLTIWRD